MASFKEHNEAFSGNVSYPSGNVVPAAHPFFPIPDDTVPIDITIKSSYVLDLNPLNPLNENFLEFYMPKQSGEFLDLTDMCLELAFTIVRGDGADIAAAENYTLINGALHGMIKSQTMYLNNQQIEQNPYFGVNNFIKMLTHVSSDRLASLGRTCFYFDTEGKRENPSVINAAAYTNAAGDFLNMTAASKNPIHLFGNLLADVSACNKFLLDDIDMRLKLEFQPPAYSIMTDGVAGAYKFKFSLAKLHLRKIVPFPSALNSLQKSLLDGARIAYHFPKPLFREIILKPSDKIMTLEAPFGDLVPHKLTFCILSQQAFLGSYSTNPTYFSNSKLEKIKVTIGGVTVMDMDVCFEDKKEMFSHLLYECSRNLGANKSQHSLTYDTFKAGRTLITLDLSPDANEEQDMQLEHRAHLRIQLNFGDNARLVNDVLLLIGETQGSFEVSDSRHIFTNFLQ